MELQFLDGIDDTGKPNKGTNTEDMEGLNNIMSELGRLLKRNANKPSGGNSSIVRKSAGVFKKKTTEQKQATQQKKKILVKKA